MQVVIVSGIFPPDIGGPATHAYDLAEELRGSGHSVVVLTLTEEPRKVTSTGLVRWPRRWPWPARLAVVTTWLVRHRLRYDVVYATGLHPAAVAGARLARRPVVVKIVGDPAWERGQRLGLSEQGFDEFQDSPPGRLRDRAMRTVRDWSVREATAVIAPSQYLRRATEIWQAGRGPEVRVVPNGVRLPSAGEVPPSRSTDRLRAVFVGRLVRHKQVDLLLEAVALAEGVELTVIGEGPEQQALEGLVDRQGLGDRVIFRGACSHAEVLAELAGADLLVLSSAYEGLPHVVIEALAVGTPVVASSAGGTGEAVIDGENGRLVEPATAESFAKVLAELRDDPVELARLARIARETGESWRFERCADEVDGLLRSLVPARGRPRIINLGKSRVDDPPGGGTERKFEIVSRHLDATFVVTGPSGVRTIAGVRVIAMPLERAGLLGGLAFYSVAPVVAVALAAKRPGTTVVCQSPYEAAGVLVLRLLLPRQRRPRVVVEVHGDWRTASRLYGSRRRRLLTPAADAVAGWSIRHADRVRAVGPTMERLALDAGFRGVTERYVTYSEFDYFLSAPVCPLPKEQRAVFVGVLELYKAPEVLLDAWRRVRDDLPQAKLTLVGEGPMAARLRSQAADLGIAGSLEFLGQVDRAVVARVLDASMCLVLPSRSEGLPRIALEAMARGRAVVGSTGGGIPDAVEDGVTGRLTPPGDTVALANALIEVLGDPERAASMGAEGRRRAEERDPAAEFEAGVARLADWTAGRS